MPERTPIILAGEAALLGNRMLGTFLCAWGGLFGGIPLVIFFSQRPAANPALWLFVLIGACAFAGGIYALGKRKQLRYTSGAPVIEEHAGLFRSQHIADHDVRAFVTVSLRPRLVVGSKGGRRTVFDIKLEGTGGHSLVLGEYPHLTAAQHAGVRAAAALGLSLSDEASRDYPLEFTAAALSPVIAKTGTDRRSYPGPTILALLAANLVPLGGVLFFDWAIFPVMLLFWVENVIIGFYNIARMLVARRVPGAARVFVALFFAAHYGGFCTVHGLFLVSLFGREYFDGTPGWRTVLDFLGSGGLWLGILALTASHGYSFVHHYIGGRVFRNIGLQQLMTAPYGRIVVLHVLLIVGAWVVQQFQAPIILLAALVAAKIVIDIAAHGRQNQGFALRRYDALIESQSAPANIESGDTPDGTRRMVAFAGPLLFAAFIVAADFFGIRNALFGNSRQSTAHAPATSAAPALPTTQVLSEIADTKPRVPPSDVPTRGTGNRVAEPGEALEPLSDDWQALFAAAERARQRHDFEAALTLYARAGERLAELHGEEHPARARLLLASAEIRRQQGMTAQYERALISALNLLAAYSAAELASALPQPSDRIDREAIARELGEHFWSRRDYAQSFTYYDYAYRLGRELELEPAEVNRRQAFNSAGRMASACMLDKWAVADEAMAELKRRITTVPTVDRERLDYWVRTGEPRLHRRNCQ